MQYINLCFIYLKQHKFTFVPKVRSIGLIWILKYIQSRGILVLVIKSIAYCGPFWSFRVPFGFQILSQIHYRYLYSTPKHTYLLMINCPNCAQKSTRIRFGYTHLHK